MNWIVKNKGLVAIIIVFCVMVGFMIPSIINYNKEMKEFEEVDTTEVVCDVPDTLVFVEVDSTVVNTIEIK